MEKLDGKSLDITKENIQALKQLFPEIVTEEKIDFEKLRMVLGDDVETHKEKYEFTWHGKTQALKLAQTPSTGSLRPDNESSKNWNTTENLYIEGDNLEVLKLLQKSYFGKIKMIYIDPPYNTGNDFVYKDDFKDNIKNYKELTEQISKSNSESNGRFHTEWLNLIYPRLKLARNLLSDDGVIFVSIDDNEYVNLKKILDEIFGEINFVASFVWKRRASSAMADKLVSKDHEYLLCYQKSSFSAFNGIEKDFNNFSNPDNDPRGEWTKGDLTVGMTREQRPNQYYNLIDPKTNKVYKPNPQRVWAYIRESMEKLIKEDKIYFPNNTGQRPMYKRFKSEMNVSVNPISTWISETSKLIDNDEVNKLYTGLNSEGTKAIQNLFDSKIFDYPKPISLIKSIVGQCTTNNDIILDFFSGSSTTAHAVMELNSEDNYNRKFIMVQLPEVNEEKSEALIAGYKNICEIGKERIRRAGDKIAKETGTDLDIGFKVFKLDSSNVKPWDPNLENLEEGMLEQLENIKEDRSKEDLLFEILLKIGIPLTTQIDKVEFKGKTIINVAFGSVLLCLEDDIDLEIVHEMIKQKPEDFDTKVIFKESGFLNDSVKTNTIQTLKKNGINDVRSV